MRAEESSNPAFESGLAIKRRTAQHNVRCLRIVSLVAIDTLFDLSLAEFA